MGEDANRSGDAARARLVETIEREVRAYGLGEGTRELDPRVRAALAKVPRERFVSTDSAALAYDNRPLPIGHRQTISQPLIVAAMTQLLRIRPGAHVLEVGTGSGYQTAILAELAEQVSTVEIVEPLAAGARRVLGELGYRNIAFRCGDGAAGWPERAPFDGIIVTAAARAIPPALLDQLKPGGRLVIPIGAMPTGQDLVLVEKDAQGQVHERRLFSVAFVPLTGGSDRA
ncbi:MAG TPA: protein-L-isoaspartate(D-aspartate) O-methyltransferase [Geminicoccaceae bacterium]|nr:protein-L-isoaspartate(D-aspartate) O-methyltransferase [Geminicoccaceae bacterium]